MLISNYFIFQQIWDLLERLQFVNKIDFLEYSSEDPKDVIKITHQWLMPVIQSLNPKNQKIIQNTFEYCLTTLKAPFGELRDSAANLDLYNNGKSEEFLKIVGESLYGLDFLNNIKPIAYTEVNDPLLARQIFLG
ncbi:hypothetical protein KIH39_15400 [Telmatocola sphagniphila]|uniref:Uncharacterized protein n=1 Tax=Telmatocola sphagniphila TaxID=1123043 RepID=A0A8E6B1Q3_9BACT|nr:hypothetical protein [Telmatocola sphagniphila]QVL30238.1 hypothetical protein KIH39_15400 [Telmatocola sphagniphila]